MVFIMNKIKAILIIFTLLLGVLVVLSPVSAATYNVYPGDDIEAIIEGSSSGDTIYVHAGTYHPTGTITMPADHITIIGDDPFTTIIDGTGLGDVITTYLHSYMIVRNLTVQNAYDDAIEVQNYCEVTNCIIYNCDDGIVYDTSGHHNTIRYCTVTDCRDDGIQVYDYNTIENCIILRNQGDGIDLGNHNNVKNCLVADNGDEGFELDDYNKILNCTISNNGADEEGDGIDGGDYCEITNCIATGNSDDGIDIHTLGGSIQYCNSWNNDEQDYDELPGGIGCISQDPQFTSGSYSWPFWYKSGVIDYFLSNSSPCINKGSTAASILDLGTGWSTTLGGRSDSGAVDMGFHFASKGSSSSLPMDKILKILKENKEK